MRELPEAPKFELKKPEDTGYATEVRQYTLITPLFGGGVFAGENDVEMLIRGSSIRGILRFWWRATRGGQFTTLKELRDAEDRIWGAPAERVEKIIEKHGSATYKPVQISVEVTSEGIPVTGTNAPKYASFPLKSQTIQKDVKFTLTLNYNKDYKEDILAALWAWENFGGIGARTRRGFGAIRRIKIPKNQKEISLDQYENSINQYEELLNKIDLEKISLSQGENLIDQYEELINKIDLEKVSLDQYQKLIQAGLKTYIEKFTWPNGVPHLSRTTSFKVVPQNWHALIGKLQEFRQGEGFARKERTGKTPGSSRWPEPDTLRRLANKHSPNHAPTHPVKKFPRAQFGLPINFHFRNPGDPNGVLKGKGLDRLASPLILRPLDSKCSIAAILKTEGTIEPLSNLEVKGKNYTGLSADLTEAEFKQIRPLEGLKFNSNILYAFLEWL